MGDYPWIMVLSDLDDDEAQIQAFVTTHRKQLNVAGFQQFQSYVPTLWSADPGYALRLAQRATAVATHLGDSECLALSLWTQANALMFTAAYQDALVCYQRAREMYNAREDQVARLSVGLVWCLAYLGQPEAALELAEEIRPILTELAVHTPQDRVRLAALWRNIGIAHDIQGRYEEALDAYDKDRRIAQELQNEMGLAWADHNRGLILIQLNEFREAEEALQRARAIFSNNKAHADVARADIVLGILYLKERRYDEALARFSTARSTLEELEEADNQLATVDLFAARVRLLMGDAQYDGLCQALEQARDTLAAQGPLVGVFEAQLLIGQWHLAAGHYAEAREAYDEALRHAEAIGPGTPIAIYRAYHGLGKLAVAERRPQAAQRCLRQAIECIELTQQTLQVDEFRASFLGDKLDVYRDMVWVCLELEDLEQAFEYVERTRSRVLVDLIGGDVRKRVTEEQEREKAQQLETLEKRLNALYHQVELTAKTALHRGGNSPLAAWSTGSAGGVERRDH